MYLFHSFYGGRSTKPHKYNLRSRPIPETEKGMGEENVWDELYKVLREKAKGIDGGTLRIEFYKREDPSCLSHREIAEEIADNHYLALFTQSVIPEHPNTANVKDVVEKRNRKLYTELDRLDALY